MAHELTTRANGFTEMAYVGEEPWHNLGQKVTKGASIDVWRKEAGLDWEAIPTTVQYTNFDGLALPYDGKQVLYRSDNQQPLGIVSDQYKIVQPADVLELFRDMTEQAGWYIHTAGTLRGGSKLWAMATNDSIKGSVGSRADQVKGNMLCATSLDGSMKTTCKLISTRVVCANTMAVALGEGGKAVTLSHRGLFDASSIKDSLGIAVESFEAMITMANEMAAQACGTDEAMTILRQLFGQPTVKPLKASSADFEFQRIMTQFTGAAAPGKAREQRSVVRCMELFQGAGLGSELAGSRATRWGLLNAVTQHIDHDRGRTDDTRMESAWFGEGERIKTLAGDLLAV